MPPTGNEMVGVIWVWLAAQAGPLRHHLLGLRHGRHHRTQWRVWCQRAVIAMPVGARWRHQLGDAVDMGTGGAFMLKSGLAVKGLQTL